MQEIDVLKLSFHIFAAIHFVYGCYYDWNYVRVPAKVHIMGIEYAGKLKFLTYWDAIVQAVFYSICILNDCIGTNEISEKLPWIRRLKDALFSCIAFPVAMFVGLTFWALYSVDRELVFPRALDPYFPVWLNHVMHTNIMLFILIEMATSFRMYPPAKRGLGTLIIFMLIYLIWMHVVYFMTDVWVYPVMAVLNTPLRIVFFLVLLGLSVSLYKLGEFINSKVWSEEIKSVKEKQN